MCVYVLGGGHNSRGRPHSLGPHFPLYNLGQAVAAPPASTPSFDLGGGLGHRRVYEGAWKDRKRAMAAVDYELFYKLRHAWVDLVHSALKVNPPGPLARGFFNVKVRHPVSGPHTCRRGGRRVSRGPAPQTNQVQVSGLSTS